jgi:GAF domain-containing protein
MIKNMNNRFSSSASPENRPALPVSFDLNEWRESFILTILRLACMMGVILIVITYPTSTFRDRVLYIGIYVALLAITILPTPYLFRAYTLLLITFAVGINAILAWGPWRDGNIFLLGSIILAAILFDRRVDVIGLTASILILSAIAAFELTGAYRFSALMVPATRVEDWVGYIVDFTIIGIVLIAGIDRFKNTLLRKMGELQNEINQTTSANKQMEGNIRAQASELETRMMQVHSSTSTARAIAQSKTISDLLETSVSLISEKFGYYQVGLYILDDQRQIGFLQAASSQAGKELIGQAFRIETDKRNQIYVAVTSNQYTLSSDLDRAYFLRDQNFPLTRSRMILPLAIRDSVFGYFDIHSDQTQAFTSQDGDVLQTVADLTAIAFENTRLVNETQNLLTQLEISASTQTQQTWSKMAGRQKPAYQYTPAGVRPIFSSDKQRDEDGLHVPLTLHGKAIGRIKLKRKGMATSWSQRERLLVGKIADQIALALENSRLVEEAQKNAARDQMIANISSSIRETLNIDSVISTAAAEMQRVFDLKEVEITVGTAQSGASADGYKTTE